jgi:starch phosphorylase
MAKIRLYRVVPALPEPLQRLQELAYNLWWSWNPEAAELFAQLDMDLWEQVYNNPVKLLMRISQDRLEEAANDPAYLANMDRVLDEFYSYLGGRTWFEREHAEVKDAKIAYFSMEFGLHEAVPIYSGGLGVLAGDHLKSASDLGLPLVGVGLLYRHGYFRQRLSIDGWQLEDYPDTDFHQIPVVEELTADGKPLRFVLDIREHPISVQVWRAQVGRVPLYLLDTDIRENAPEDREITARLYGGDQETRFRQEILLAIGGMRALALLGIDPTVCHMNEGHSALLGLERIRVLIERDKLSFAEAREMAFVGSLFTTHTPVPAGIDTFPRHMVETYLSQYLEGIGLSCEGLMKLGQRRLDDADGLLTMPILAMRLAMWVNGVSALHGQVARGLFGDIWPQLPKSEVPIGSVTNGVHTCTWLGREMAELLNRYLGPQWRSDPAAAEAWERVDRIPDAELWRTHERAREQLMAFVRRQLRRQRERQGAPPTEVKAADEVLDPQALTIGFARRFASYKRATLVLSDLERLARLVGDADHPLQFIFAGKAHPRDNAGKELLKKIVQVSQRPEFRGRIVFLEDHDMNAARVLVQGVDVWLNNPLRLHEASGTSGMKVSPNGGLNMSVLDGWWPEAYREDLGNGWAIGDGRLYEDLAYQDRVESQAILDLLEKEVIPLFYDRGTDGLPRRWLARMKASIKSICPFFNTHRMLADYLDRYYLPAHQRWSMLGANGFERARRLSAWKAMLADRWREVRIELVEPAEQVSLRVGAEMSVSARVRLGRLQPQEVRVELYYGPVGTDGELVSGTSVPMQCAEKIEDGLYGYAGRILCESSGLQGYAVRVLPSHEDMARAHETGLICWG